MEIATSIIRINAFSLRKPITDLAGLKTKPRTESTRPSRIPPILLPRVLKPYSTPLTTDFRPPVNELTITPIVVITARTTAETIRCNAGDEKTSRVAKEIKLNLIYRTG
ncbi:hypothetical protein pdam_00008543 [Pocillopora damicornis]|uniref:Uncharacterized protein n=1 Tax=Pocillopora damicornis TaxID=46731 RepID=A0A3M6U2Y7_POCDA|nr:hypothetical protein pdam_00008543 [Pocillopora damicornis]